ncbi:conserved hypothetical protein, partial [Trichinella spiralis]|uniref:hypothetical protein n=1 Tax=Trichinella spiralis TaxID=6334 RepID=UPI0001EFCCFE
SPFEVYKRGLTELGPTGNRIYLLSFLVLLRAVRDPLRVFCDPLRVVRDLLPLRIARVFAFSFLHCSYL